MSKRPIKMNKRQNEKNEENKNSDFIGVGTDIESVKRFQQLPYQDNQNFYSNIFSDQEIKCCLAKPNPYQSFTARFAAKESIIKAVSPTILSFKDIEIEESKESNESKRTPLARIKKNTAPKFKIKISLSHTEDFATAVALVTNFESRGK